MLLKFLVLLGLVLLGALQWVWAAPYDPDRWHVPPPLDVREGQRANSFQALRPLNAPAEDVFAAIGRIALQSPRTKLRSGSPESGMLTFETRSAFWRFPDFTTITIIRTPDGGEALSIFGRARFGYSDLGVNQSRIEAWVSELGGLLGPPD